MFQDDPGSASDPTSTPSGGGGTGRGSLLGTQVGQFRLTGELGRGGMGTVYLGEHVLIGSRVAVKVLHPHLANDPATVDRFFDEARAVNLIGHENIVRIFDMDELPGGGWYLVMEYLSGQPLSRLAQQPLPEGTARSLLLQILDALDAAHARNIVHRDVKPENIFVSPHTDGTLRARLLDFGIARFFGESRRNATQPGTVIGTPAYMAPEQWEGGHVDGRADVYAVGVLGWTLCAGRNPFEERSLRDLLALPREALAPPRGVSADYCSAMTRAMAVRREDRFASAAEMRRALEGRASRPSPVPPAADREESRASADVTWAGRTRRLPLSDLSRAGAFVECAADAPPARALVSLVLQLPGGELACRAEVVRHVSAAEARAWKMSPGFAVQFLDAGHKFADQLSALRRPGTPSSVTEDAAASARVRTLGNRLGSDAYALLGLSPEASFPEVRRAGRALLDELSQLGAARLSTESRRRLTRLVEQVQMALYLLSHPERRAESDARRGNFRGVAQCFAAGLSATDAERLRAGWLKDYGRFLPRAHLHKLTGELYEKHGDLGAALSEYEKALALDPLELSLHQSHAAVQRRLRAQTGA